MANTSPKIFPVPPALRENPYQRLLYQAVEKAGGGVLPAAKLSMRDPGPPPPEGGVVHVHWLWLKQGSLRRILRWTRLRAALRHVRKLGWRVVWTAHNVSPHEPSRLERSLHGHLAATADGIIAHGEEARRQLLESYPITAPIAVIPHGHYRDAYPPAPVAPDAREQLGLDPERPIFLSLGQIRPYKNIEELIRTFRQGSIEADLLIAGRPTGGVDPRHLEALAGGDPRIHLRLDFVPDAEIPALMGAASWVVLPFNRITSSGSLILALSFGRPVVIPRYPVLLEVAGEDAAVSFEPGGGLTEALARAAQRDPEEAGRAASRRADTMDWLPIGESTVAFMRELVATPR